MKKGRFKCQALLDEQALLACMAYVDLNPIRAGVCNTLEGSKFTSIAQRLAEFTANSTIPENPENKPLNLKPKFSSDAPPPTPIPLADFVAGSQTLQGIPYSLTDYFELVDWTGRAIRDDSPRGYSLAKKEFTSKRGYIPQSEPKIIHKLVFASCKTSIYHIHVKNWVSTQKRGWKPLAISLIAFIPLSGQKKK